MEKVEEKSIYSFKNLSEENIYYVVRRFAETLVLLHELRLNNTGLNVPAMPEDEYTYARKSALVKEEMGCAKNWDYGRVTDWLKVNAERCPCKQYSLLKFDLNLKNFIIANEGKIFFLNWE